MSGSMMGGVDSSIPLQAGTGRGAPLDPTKQIGDFVSISNALNAGDLQKQALQRGQVDLATQFKRAAAQHFAPYLAPGAVINHQTITQAAANAERYGIPTGGFVHEMASFPAGDGPEFEARFKNWVLANAQPAENAVGAVVGALGDQSTGRETLSGVRRPAALGGGFYPATATPILPSRSEQSARVPGPPGPNGEATTVPLGSVTPSSISGLNMGTGRIRDGVPAALRNPSAPPSPLPGQITTGVGPAASAAMGGQGATSNAAFQNISNEGVKARQQDAILANMQNELTQFTSGTGADRTLDIKRALVSWAPGIASSIGVDPKVVAANESFNKLASQIADAQGAGSDARLAVNQAANPSAHLSPEGADMIIRQLRGNTDYLKARQALAAAHPDQTDARGFEAKVASNLDPRVFQFARLNAEQRADYYKGIKNPTEREAFKRSFLWAEKSGLVAP